MIDLGHAESLQIALISILSVLALLLLVCGSFFAYRRLSARWCAVKPAASSEASASSPLSSPASPPASLYVSPDPSQAFLPVGIATDGSKAFQQSDEVSAADERV